MVAPFVLEGPARFPLSDGGRKPPPLMRVAKKIRESREHRRAPGTCPEQPCRLERAIVERTGNRVHALRVEIVQERVIVHGWSGSYHVQQLALAAVLDVLATGASERPAVELQIELRRSW